MNSIVPITLPDGVFVAHFTERGLARLEWPRPTMRKRSAARATPASSGADEKNLSPALRAWLRQTRAALECVVAGKKPRQLPPLDLSAGTPFQRQLWGRLRQIPAGRTRTYAELASALGRPRAARAVGNACGANPIPLLVPCHRVVPSGGGLGGFSGPLEWKQRLLEIEKAAQ